jgi:Fur family peroxide stress response transcriptional regulator
MSLTNEELDQRVSDFMEVCRREGVKITYQRLEIYKEIDRSEDHPDAETIYRKVRRKLPTISFDTVYRTTSTLEKLNVISRLHIQSDRMRLDANIQPHHHFVCKKCGLVRDVYISGIDSLKIPDELSNCATIQSVHVELQGTCGDCKGRDEKNTECAVQKLVDNTQMAI